MPTHQFTMEMTCEGCANAAKRVLAKLASERGVEVTAETDVSTQTVTVTSELPAADLLAALQKTGKTISQKS
ncbi:hypothetical protein BOX15_Mlig025338g1 [Macrostomum lignano]|uniref:Copper transport protein ATOX1 n=1 Tax=Macrostomum lignano TaxID=282301 RepID=A0A267GDC8_9PLAT|nr:hypothetical protein BOX15_Mlig025338g1 [Macrostomum lignano]